MTERTHAPTPWRLDTVERVTTHIPGRSDLIRLRRAILLAADGVEVCEIEMIDDADLSCLLARVNEPAPAPDAGLLAAAKQALPVLCSLADGMAADPEHPVGLLAAAELARRNLIAAVAAAEEAARNG